MRTDFVDVSRKIRPTTKLVLIAASGGRCAFNGCNRYLFAHDVTKKTGYFGNLAHVRAFSPGGPRADATLSREWINAVDNLMLLCPGCHKLIDDEPATFTVEKLRAWKREHDERVAFLLDLPRENEAAMLELWTDVSRTPVVRSQSAMVAALLPLYPSRRHSYLVDFSGKSLSDATMLPAAVAQIDHEVSRLFSSGGERPSHIAVFGITNMPLLAYLGAKLGDRINVHLFQHHRDTSDWRWKDESASCEYSVQRLTNGTQSDRVALIVSLSGAIDVKALPAAIDSTFSIYRLELTNRDAGLGFLRARDDLQRFRDVYKDWLARLRNHHGVARQVAVFPAVPVPIAVALGMDRLPKVDPELRFYDFDKRHGWREALVVP